MTTPTEALKVKQQKAKKKLKYNPHPQKKNLFEHMSEGMGMSLTKTMKGQKGLLETVKNVILSLSVYAAIGYIIGLILDMFLKSPYPLSSVLCLVMVLFWIIRKGKTYLMA